MSIEKTGRGGHITGNGIRLTDMQKYKKFEQTNTTKKKRKNNKTTPSVVPTGES